MMMTLVYKGLRDVISDGRDTVECGAAGSPRRCIVNHHHHCYRNHINGWMDDHIWSDGPWAVHHCHRHNDHLMWSNLTYWQPHWPSSPSGAVTRVTCWQDHWPSSSSPPSSPPPSSPPSSGVVVRVTCWQALWQHSSTGP